MSNKTRLTHPAYGMANFTRVTGQTNLFGVDYPQGHYMTLNICVGSVDRHYGEDWFTSEEEIIQIAMSEVQFARLIASPNTQGVPCTIMKRPEGKAVQVEPMPTLETENKRVKEEFAARGREMSKLLDDAEKALSDMIRPENKPNKTKISDVLQEIRTIRRSLTSDMPFYIQQLQETVDRTTSSAKAEVEAYANHVMSELGKEALGERIRNGEIPIRIGSNQQNMIEDNSE